jgi:hypothetical protein
MSLVNLQLSCSATVAVCAAIVLGLLGNTKSELGDLHITLLVAALVNVALNMVGPKLGLTKANPLVQLVKLAVGCVTVATAVLALPLVDQVRRNSELSDRSARDNAVLAFGYLATSLALVCGIGAVSDGASSVLGVRA